MRFDDLKYEIRRRWPEQFDRRRTIVIGVGAVVMIGLVVVFSRLALTATGEPEPLRVQAPKGSDAVQRIGPVLASDAGWSGVRIVASEADGDSKIIVMGTVASDGSLRALRDRIESEADDLEVQWQVVVVPEG